MTHNTYELRKSTKSDKKWMVITPSGKKVHFGQNGASNYTKHGDYDRMLRYINRHGGSTISGKPSSTSTKENWKKSGLDTAGFWSRWLTWNKPTLTASIKDIEKRFNIKIVKKR